MARLPRLRHRVELPPLRARPCVERPRVADAAHRSGRRVGAHHDDVVVHQRHRVVRHADIDRAALPEAVRRLAGRRIERDKRRAARGEDDPGRERPVTRPPGDAAARGRAGGGHVPPLLFPGRRIECDDAVRRREVHHAIDHDRRHLRVGAPVVRAAVLAVQVVGPGAGKAADVRGRDLIERRIAGSRGGAAVHRPVARIERRRRRGQHRGRRGVAGRRLGGPAAALRKNQGHQDAGESGQSHRSHGASFLLPEPQGERRIVCYGKSL